jgi:hypothetical protein
MLIVEISANLSEVVSMFLLAEKTAGAILKISSSDMPEIFLS